MLSSSTQDADRGEKWAEYQTVPSLHDYVLIAQDKAEVWLYSRDGDGWRFQVVHGLDASVVLPSVSVVLSLSDLYALVEWNIPAS